MRRPAGLPVPRRGRHRQPLPACMPRAGDRSGPEGRNRGAI
jgi:hypothetical protein